MWLHREWSPFIFLKGTHFRKILEGRGEASNSNHIWHLNREITSRMEGFCGVVRGIFAMIYIKNNYNGSLNYKLEEVGAGWKIRRLFSYLSSYCLRQNSPRSSYVHFLDVDSLFLWGTFTHINCHKEWGEKLREKINKSLLFFLHHAHTPFGVSFEP